MDISLLTMCFVTFYATVLSQNIQFKKEVTEAPRCLAANEGKCVDIKWCPSALRLLENNDIKSLERLICSIIDGRPQVCCAEVDRLADTESMIVFDNETEITTTKPVKSETNDTVIENITSIPLDLESTTFNEKTTKSRSKDNENATKSQSEDTEENPFPDTKVCGVISTTNRIVGGLNTEINEFPWLARIQFKNVRTGMELFACAGSLISKRFVVSAAHCFTNGERMRPNLVRLGEWDIEQDIDCEGNRCNDKPVDMRIDAIFIHPDFKKMPSILPTSDIALLKLEAPVKYTDFIQPVCLPTTEYTAEQDYLSRSTYTIAGWGLTEYGNVSPIKRKAYVEAVPFEACQNILQGILDSSTDKIICAGGKRDVDSCRGDSGGSLARAVSENYQINWYLYGITSAGVSECGSEGVPGVYTRVVKYIDWITSIVKNN